MSPAPARTDDAVMAEGATDAAVDRWVQAALDGAPPLTAEQVDQLRGLLPRPERDRTRDHAG